MWHKVGKIDPLIFRPEICKIAGQKIGVLMRLRNLIPTNAKLMFFKTAILPHLTYCHLVWHFCRASDSRKIERMQERGLRAVLRNNVSYPELLKRAELPSLQTGDYKTLVF